MSETHKEAKMAPFHGWFRTFLCRNEEEDDQVINLKHCDGCSKISMVPIDSYGGLKPP